MAGTVTLASDWACVLGEDVVIPIARAGGAGGGPPPPPPPPAPLLVHSLRKSSTTGRTSSIFSHWGTCPAPATISTRLSAIRLANSSA
jgi:hypothetical protein